MLEIAKTIYEVLIDLVEILQGLGELGLFLAKLFYRIGKGIYFIIHLPWPLPLVVAALIIVLSFFLREYIIRAKIIGFIALGLWIHKHMSVEIIRNIGLTLAISGLGILFLDFLIRKGVIKPPSLFPKEKREKKKKKK